MSQPARTGSWLLASVLATALAIPAGARPSGQAPAPALGSERVASGQVEARPGAMGEDSAPAEVPALTPLFGGGGDEGDDQVNAPLRDGWIAWGLVGLGAASLGIGVVFLADATSIVQPKLAEAQANLADRDIACPGATYSKQCFQDERDLLSLAASLDFITAFFAAGAGVALLSTGVGLLLEEGE